MDKIELKKRTKKFAVDIIVFLSPLPYNKGTDVISKQLLRSATSVGANYRCACRGKSTADFINKIIIVEEEADESVYWLELLEETNLVQSELIDPLKKEANELTAIFTSIGRTSKFNQLNSNPKSNIRNPKSA